MLKSLFGRGKAKRAPSTPAGARAYAVGDVHGCRALLDQLLERIERDNRERGPATTYLVLLGDLVDRGPDSRGVIERLLGDPPRFARNVVLKGNHEEFFERVLDGDDEVIPRWLTYGGQECAQSYGLGGGWMLNARAPEIGERLREAVPQAHRQFLADMTDTFRFGDYLFVHAGIRPGVALDSQRSGDLRWIREGFLDDSTDHGLMVVHGHTIVTDAEQHPNRIALDTGAYRSGVLTALGLEGTERWFLTARSGDLSAAA